MTMGTIAWPRGRCEHWTSDRSMCGKRGRWMVDGTILCGEHAGTTHTSRRERTKDKDDLGALEQKVQRVARKAASARQELEAAIREARAGGASLRALAAASGFSHEQVRRICG